MHKVSVVMAAYNCKNDIDRVINSLKCQTHSDWELIVCDDCSSDGTYERILEHAKHDTRIKVLKSKQNQGQAGARNACIEIAEGEYIAVQDADDYSAANRLEKQVYFLESNWEYDFVSSSAFIFGDDGKVCGSRMLKENPLSKDFLKGLPFIHPATMFRKTALKRINGYRVSKETRRGEDFDLFIRLYQAGHKGYNIQENLYYYYEGIKAFKRRKLRYRLHGYTLRISGYRKLQLMPLGYLYALRHLLIGLIPTNMMIAYQRSILK